MSSDRKLSLLWCMDVAGVKAFFIKVPVIIASYETGAEQ
jgi:hypothetical protein